jgi:hypothetical protein
VLAKGAHQDYSRQGRTCDLLVPSLAGNRAARLSVATFERAAISPSMARALVQSYRAIDVTSVLGTISVPTLVLHRRDDWIDVRGGRYIAEHIDGARFVELEGADHAYFTQDSDAILDEVERFLTGGRTAPEPDRVLATVLFTDIVDSTRRASELGDARWRDLLERHDALVRQRIEAAGGRVINRLATARWRLFRGPHAQFGVPMTSCERARALGFSSGPAFTPVNARRSERI